jgi:hypothetical protein
LVRAVLLFAPGCAVSVRTGVISIGIVVGIVGAVESAGRDFETPCSLEVLARVRDRILISIVAGDPAHIATLVSTVLVAAVEPVGWVLRTLVLFIFPGVAAVALTVGVGVVGAVAAVILARAGVLDTVLVDPGGCAVVRLVAILITSGADGGLAVLPFLWDAIAINVHATFSAGLV